MLENQALNVDLKFLDQIDEIMDNMDFAKIAIVMEALNWTWANIGDVPEERDIRSNARRILRDCVNTEGNCIASGGFTARVEDGILTLSFVVADYSAE